MRLFIAAAGVVALFSASIDEASAQAARPDSLTLTCQQAQALVQSRGGLIIGTGPYVYDRYVSGKNFCEINQRTRPAFIQTRDSAQCFIGYQCHDFQNRNQ